MSQRSSLKRMSASLPTKQPSSHEPKFRIDGAQKALSEFHCSSVHVPKFTSRRGVEKS